MTTISNLTDQIERDFIVPLARPEYDTLGGSHGVSGQITLSTTEALVPGSILDVNYELAYVLSYNPNLRTATCKRGFLGTTATSGSSGDLVRINPRFSSAAILDAITDELRSWDSRLFVVQREELTFGKDDVSVMINPTRQPYYGLGMRKRPQTASDVDAHRTMVPFRITRSEDTVDSFSSGYAAHISQSFGISTTVDAYYALPFDISGLTSSSSLESTHGLTVGMLEILKWGAVARLMAGRETVRADFTVHSRPDLEANVPAGMQLQSGQSYMRMRDMIYDKEYRLLIQQWGMRYYG